MNDKLKMIDLCKMYTALNEEEINVLYKKAQALEELAEMFDCDVFIDVPFTGSTASIVVYHIMPVSKRSLYKHSPVGELALKVNEPGVWRVSRYGGSLKGYKAFTQGDDLVRQSIYAIKHDDRVLGTYILEKSLNESVHPKEEQKDFMTMTARVNKYIEDPIYFFDSTGKLIFHNNIADTFPLDVSEENLHYNDLFGKQLPYNDLVFREGTKVLKEIQLNGKYYQLTRILLDDDKLGFAIILRDITQLKDKEAEIISKNEAVRETHHRIKNNLQTMASLLRMEKRRNYNHEVQRVLTNNINQVMSIAATHDILARHLGDEVDLSLVLKFIITNLRRSYAIMDEIELIFEAKNAPVVLSDVATSVSLIVNELVQNCFDHAFPNQKQGRIYVSLEKANDNIVVSIIDDGIGFNIDKIDNNRLGLMIVRSYVKDKLSGTIQFNKRNRGMDITFRFKSSAYEVV